MEFHPTSIGGAVRIVPQRHTDDRGFFARSWCVEEFAAQGLSTRLVQCNISYNHRRGTLRGMHFQAAPHAEIKLVRCTAGAIYDVILDLRADSPTRFQWEGFELSAENRELLYIPEGIAHGFITLCEHSEVFYQMGQLFVPRSARGIRWNDPAFRIEWPVPVEVISDRDASYADWDSAFID